MTKILDGNILKQKIINQLREKTKNLSLKPGLGIILIGRDPSSKIYVRNKISACREADFYYETFFLKEDCKEEEIINSIKNLNNNKKIHGILVQYPLPKKLIHLEKKINQLIDPLKDVDCFNPVNIGKMFLLKTNSEKIFFPCTAKGIISLLKYYKINIKGKNALVIGRGSFSGKSTALMLVNEDATVTLAHSKTKNLFELSRNADILVVAVGKTHFIKKENIKKNSIIIDVGINIEGNNIYGDVDYQDVFDKTGAITPVPGGVGPMTIASLLENLYLAYQVQKN